MPQMTEVLDFGLEAFKPDSDEEVLKNRKRHRQVFY
jgi:hypothetical protein